MIYQEWGWRKRVAAIGVAVMVLAERSRAQVWQVGVGDWLNAGNWSGGLPSYYSGGLIFINNGGTAQVTTGAAGASILEVGESEYPPLPAQSGVVTISGGTLSTGSERLGGSGGGTITQSGGTNTIPYPDVEAPQGPASSLLVGYTGPGYYNLSAGTLAVGTATDSGASISEYIGYGRTGTFMQSGGTNSIVNQGSLYLGALSGSAGNYSLSGGSLLVTGNAGYTPASEYVGDVGTGTFLQTGGLNSITGPGDNLYLGDSNLATGKYTLAGGTLTVAGESTAGNYSTEYVGYSGQGEFVQTGGTNNAGWLILGATNADGIYLLSGGQLTIGAGEETIAARGQATFIQSGGTNAAISVTVGQNSGSNGSYTLNGGVLTSSNMFNSGYLFLAQSTGSTGSFTQTGGTFALGQLFIDTAGGTATFEGGLTTTSVTNSGLLAITAPVGSNSYGVLDGGFTQNAGGQLLIGVGGDPSTTEFGSLSLGYGKLGGTLDVSFINGFTPTVGETFDFLTLRPSGYYIGQFTNVISNYPVQINYMSDGVSITVIPEPSSVALLVVATGLLARRRSRQNSIP